MNRAIYSAVVKGKTPTVDKPRSKRECNRSGFSIVFVLGGAGGGGGGGGDSLRLPLDANLLL